MNSLVVVLELFDTAVDVGPHGPEPGVGLLLPAADGLAELLEGLAPVVDEQLDRGQQLCVLVAQQHREVAGQLRPRLLAQEQAFGSGQLTFFGHLEKIGEKHIIM